MDAEDFRLKYRISRLSDQELLEMIRNHYQYRQLALELAMAQLSERRIQFITPRQNQLLSIKRLQPLGGY